MILTIDKRDSDLTSKNRERVVKLVIIILVSVPVVYGLFLLGSNK